MNRIYRYAARRLGWAGTNPVSLLLPSERPKPGQSTKRRLFEGGELEQTIAAAGDPCSTLFTLAALTGARVSELSALRWTNVHISDLDDAEVEFACQVGRHGNVRPTKTDGSVRTVPIPGELAAILSCHNDRSRFSKPQDFVFSTCTRRPFGQRNVARALRRAQQKAVDRDGRPSSPSCTSATGSASWSRCRTARCPRCIASASLSPVARCSQVKASTRWRSC